MGAKDLVADLQSGNSVIDVAKAQSVSEQTLVDALLAPEVDSLNLRVKYGYLTQQ